MSFCVHAKDYVARAVGEQTSDPLRPGSGVSADAPVFEQVCKAVRLTGVVKQKKRAPQFRRRVNPHERQLHEPAEEERPRRPVDAERARTRTLQRAVKMLAAKPRSIGELRERLLEKSWATEEAVEYAIEKLKEHRYLDDAQFAQSFAGSRVKGKPMGRSRVARDLTNKKIDPEVAQVALDKIFDETPEEELIDEAIRRYTRIKGAPTDRPSQKRLFDFLMRRGFSYDLIAPRVRAVAAADASYMESEEF